MEEFDIYNMLKYGDGFIDFEINEKELILRYLADNFANFSRKKIHGVNLQFDTF
jgi:hypothetical protein